MRRFISILLSIALIFSVLPMSVSAEETTDTPVPTGLPTEVPTETLEPILEPDYETGDVDGNGKINAQDALLVLKNAAKLEDLTETQYVAADVDDSGKVNATDALYILQYAAKIIVRFAFTPEENIPILKEYIMKEGSVETGGVYVIEKDYVEENDSDYEKEVDSFTYNSNSGRLVYRYDVGIIDDKGSYDYSYIIGLGEYESDIRVIYNEKSEEMNIEFDVQKTIENSSIRFTDDFNVDLVKYKYEAEYLDKNATANDIIQFEQDNADYINALMHMAILSMEDYLKNTVVMNLDVLGFDFAYSNEEFDKVFDIFYGYDNNITQSTEELKQFIANKGVKDGDSIYISGIDELLSNNKNEGLYYGCEVVLMYGTEVDALVFSGYTYYYNENIDCIILTNILPMDNRESYIYVKVFEPDGNGEYVGTAEYEAMINSKEAKFGGEYDFAVLSERDSSKRELFIGFANASVYQVLLESHCTWYYDYGCDSILPSELGYINLVE